MRITVNNEDDHLKALDYADKDWTMGARELGMVAARIIPDDPLAFIRDCVAERRVFWTHHVNMRMKERRISREMVFASVRNYEIIEAHPEDKYLPSYLVLARYGEVAFHALFAVDVPDRNVRVVTAYYPDPDEWAEDLRTRVKP